MARATKKKIDYDSLDFLTDIVTITNPEECISFLASLTGTTPEKLVDELPALNAFAREATPIYYTVECEFCEADSLDAHYMLIPTGKTRKGTGEPLYYSCYRHSDNRWLGALVHTIEVFKQKSEKYYNENIVGREYITEREETPFEKKVKTTNQKSDLPATTTVEVSKDHENIKERFEPLLNYMKNMCTNEMWLFNTADQLLDYLVAVELKSCSVAKRAIESKANPTGFLRLNNKRDKLLINTGITSKLGNPILLICSFSGGSKFDNVEVLRCRDSLIGKGFTHNDAISPPESIRFAEKVEELTFHGQLSDVDVENPNSLNHILVERAHRLPAYMQGLSYNEKCDIFFNKLQLAFKRQEIDHSYFKAFYNMNLDAIGFIIPMYKDDNPDGELEFGVVLSKSEHGYWIAPTVLDVAQVRRSVKVLTPFARI